MTLNPRFTFGPIKGVLSVSFALSRGTSPSVCTVSILPTPELDTRPHPMVFSDGVRTMTFRDCIISDVSPSVDGQGQLTWDVAILDRRWKWGFGQVSAEYNVRGEDGKILEATRRTPKQLLKIIFDAIGEKQFETHDVPSDTFPYVHWTVERPNAALEELCRSLNCHVSLTVNDVPAIFRDGTGKDLPNLPSSSHGAGFDFGIVPDSVGVLSAPMLWELDFPLTLVGIDFDGTIKHRLEELSYFPKDPKDSWDSGSFAGVQKKYQDLAIETVWKTYAIGLPIDLFKTLEPIKKMPIADAEILDLSQFFPMMDFRLETNLVETVQRDNRRGAFEKKVWKREPAVVHGIFSKRDGKSEDNVTELLHDLRKQPKQVYGGSWTIDQERYLVRFGDQVSRVTPLVRTGEDTFTGAQRIPAKLFLRCAVRFLDPYNRQFYRLYKTKKLAHRSHGTQTAWTVREDLEAQWTVNYLGKVVTNGGKDPSDKELGKAMDYYLDLEVKRYETKTPAHASYPILVPFAPDGRIAQVVFSIDGEGYIGTSVHRESEALLNLPSYKERRDGVILAATLQKLSEEAKKPPKKDR